MPQEPETLTQLRRRDISRTADYRHTSNDSAVLQSVLDHGPVARSTVARLAGLSPAAVSRLAADLIAAGMLRESAQAVVPKAAGRPHVPIDVDTSRLVVCGLHIGLGYTKLSLLDLRGRLIAQQQMPHHGLSPRDVLARAGARIPAFIAAHAAGRTAVGLGVATGGWVDRADGVIVEHGLLGWRDVPVRRVLSEATGLTVQVDNHARALTRAEQLFGDPRARESVVHLFVGNVIDAAFATGGRIHHGPQSAAGSVAHLPLQGRTERCACGLQGCLQVAASNRVLGMRAHREGITTGPEFLLLLAAANGGNRRAVALLRERARLLGAGVAVLLDVLNPELLVISEHGIRCFPECLEALRAGVAERSRAWAHPGRSIVVSSFGGDALLIASGAVALDAVYADPLGRRRVIDEAC